MIERILLSPVYLNRLFALKRDVYEKVGEFSAKIHLSHEPIPPEEFDRLDYEDFAVGKTWTKEKFDCAVFRLSGEIPSSAKGKKVVARLKLGAEALVYRDGKAVCGVTPVLSYIDVGQPTWGKQIVPLFDCAEGGEKIELVADCGHNGYCGVFLYDPRLVKCDLCAVDEEKRGYYYDYLYLLLLLTTEKDNDKIDKEVKKQLRALLSESYTLYRKGDVKGAREKLSPYLTEKRTDDDVTYSCVGHGHLDLAWKWPLREGKRKAVRTFANVTDYLDRGYDFVFGASQAQMFEWAESDPVVFERVKRAVADGKIEIQGGMWTECDNNLPCGESLVRQFLYGERYFIDRFGKSSDVVWLPDAFGFPATLPQIFVGTGKKYFATIKLNWNLYNKFPYQSFDWVAPDGSRVLSHISPEGSYHATATPTCLVKSDNKNVQKDVKNALIIYGVSDGGGGPGEGHLEMLSRAGTAHCPIAKPASSHDFFEALSHYPVPEYDGELYLERHQGTLTSQAKEKRLNRMCERAFHLLEWLESVTGDRYEKRDEVWKRLLTQQFHDILPGSGIGRVHDESVEELNALYEMLRRAIASRVTLVTRSKKKSPSALNPSPFPIREKVLFNGQIYLADCAPYASASLIPCEGDFRSVGACYIENDFLKVKFDQDYGVITSVYDKEKMTELNKGIFHALVVYEDPKSRYDAWDIKREYLDKKKRLPKLLSFRVENEPLGGAVYAQYVFGRSAITQKITLRDKNILFETSALWQESHKMLRADFSPSIYSDLCRYDIQFGSVSRSTKDETSIERAQYEVCGHYYAAVGDDEQGYFAVLNDCKYGYRAKEGKISLNLLRSPKSPDPNCDMGTHVFRYQASFAPDERTVVAEGYNFNNPLLLSDADLYVKPLFSIRDDSLIVETVKISENADGTILRVYERFGNTVRPTFTLPDGYDLYETDLLERGPKPVSELIFTPHQIKTFLLKKRTT
ncbi:MAG: alpha-mannosidase [Clostridia bacterium]|nr:alpha-mannosidase [Clostridia bacterium]